jgi:hypothetical protein
MTNTKQQTRATALIMQRALTNLIKRKKRLSGAEYRVLLAAPIDHGKKTKLLNEHLALTIAAARIEAKLNAFDIELLRRESPDDLPENLRYGIDDVKGQSHVARRKFVKAAWGVLYIPDDRLESTFEWCERNVYVSPRVPTSAPGQWRRSNVPALCARGGPLEALDDPTVETVVVLKGSQTALTTSAYCWLMKEQATDPASALIVMNSTVDARDKAAETWRPLWEDSDRLRDYLPANSRRDWTKLFQLVNNAPVYWIGANSPGRLGAKPIRRLILDEVDKYPKGFGRSKRGIAGMRSSEAGAAALARQRTKAFRKAGLAKILEFSTPTDEAGEIYQEYSNGDQRKLFIRCPHCGFEQNMIWKHWVIDMTLAKTDATAAINSAHYACPNCKRALTDRERWDAIAAGEWRPTAKPKDPKCRSFSLPSWCSTFVTTSYLAAQWVRAQNSQSALQDFINSECAEPFVHYDNSILDSQFLQLEGDYKEGELWTEADAHKGTIPEDEEAAVFGGVDVQKDRLFGVFRQFTRSGESGLIWAGDVSDLYDMDDLAVKFNASFILIDMRHKGREIQEWCYAHTGYIPTAGVIHKERRLYTWKPHDLDEGLGKGEGRKIKKIHFDANMMKDILAELIHKKRESVRWLVPRGYSRYKAYTDQMSAERCVNGEWVNPSKKDNHLWDAEILALLGAISLGFFRWFNLDENEETNKNKED